MSRATPRRSPATCISSARMATGWYGCNRLISFRTHRTSRPSRYASARGCDDVALRTIEEFGVVLAHIWTAWSGDPAIWLVLVGIGGAYALCAGPFAARVGAWERASRREQVAFWSGWVLLALTLVSPHDALGREVWFSAHMLQVMLLNSLIAPLLLLGLPEGWVRAVTRRSGPLGEGGTLLLWAVAAVLFNGVFLFWHASAVYEVGLRNEAVRDSASLTLLLTE